VPRQHGTALLQPLLLDAVRVPRQHGTTLLQPLLLDAATSPMGVMWN
jgi:hypothetical protein